MAGNRKTNETDKTDKMGMFYKIWSLLLPFVLYYAVYVLSYMLLSSCFRTVSLTKGEGSFLTGQEATLAGVINGGSMLTGALVLMPMLCAELRKHREQAASRQDDRPTGEEAEGNRRSGRKQENQEKRRNGRNGWKAQKILTGILTVILAVSSSIGLNILLTLTGFAGRSEGYQEVAQSQYSVAVGVGVVLYAVVSPMAEEIVFRGILYNRMRRYFGGWPAAVVLSGVLFGVYHGNLVQGVYGGCLGILMAYLYERTHTFYIPCLFHGAANCVVYLTAQNGALHERIFTVPWCVALLFTSLLLCSFFYRLRW